MTPAQQAYNQIKKALTNEKAMRKRVLSGASRDTKVREMDDSLVNLDYLMSLINAQQGMPDNAESTTLAPKPYQQEPLF